ncbi:hypothetical protein HUT06_39555 [Actinomadura sp. NAK00032]|uniref:hypothetical protein n=1 Tax=Actinomadura sp. NAK00032 TaxID=2742128 RepID=UPI00158FB2BF|nr:hypothetical protein [Actinomadura sp. NAK00032]QKW39381.1 hypothetical protein HUT06_39555 [Actinomadura sp. NAK00032]
MAEMTGDDAHKIGHSGIGSECPTSCLGVRTVGDLLGLLVEAGRTSGLDAVFPAAVAAADRRHEHADGRIGLACPVACLGLSAQVVTTLRNDRRRRVKTVGELLGLLRSGGLGRVPQMGPRRVGEVRVALLAAGFPVPADL